MTKARCSGEIPEPSTMCSSFITEKYLGIHGGINCKNVYLSTLFIMDLVSFKWEQVTYSVNIPEYNNWLYPQGVAQHQMVPVFKQKRPKKTITNLNSNKGVILKEGIYTFGGKSRDTHYNYDLLLLKLDDTKTFKFTKPATLGQPPQIRA